MPVRDKIVDAITTNDQSERQFTINRMTYASLVEQLAT
jgi:hypothetical protein